MSQEELCGRENMLRKYVLFRKCFGGNCLGGKKVMGEGMFGAEKTVHSNF